VTYTPPKSEPDKVEKIMSVSILDKKSGHSLCFFTTQEKEPDWSWY